MRTCAAVLAAVFLCLIPVHAKCAGEYSVIHNFAEEPDNGERPWNTLLSDGSKLYGMTYYGGATEEGTIFSLNGDGSNFTLLRSFSGPPSDGSFPWNSLMSDGSKLYGMTYYGGADDTGTIFSMNSDGSSFDILHDFDGGATDGGWPSGGLISDGSKLYGMTEYGGSTDDGVIFSINPNGSSFGLLHTFHGGASDGAAPWRDLTLVNGLLYGMTNDGGAHDMGTIFSIGTTGSAFTLLRSFAGEPDDGAHPGGNLIQVGSKLYGMTPEGGAHDMGTIFSLNTDGSGFAILHSFAGEPDDGAGPYGGNLLSHLDKLYGMTWYGGADDLGTLFSINTDGSAFTILHSFAGEPNDGKNGGVGLVSDGVKAYGVTEYGGTDDDGTIFSWVLPLPPAQVILNGSSFGAGSLFNATFRANEAVTRTFNAYAVVVLPGGAMLDAITLSPSIKPAATNVPGLPAGFSYQFMSLTIPAGAPAGDYSVMVGLFAPGVPIHGPGDAFLLATTPFVIS